MISKGKLQGLVDDVNEVFENHGTKGIEGFCTNNNDTEIDRKSIDKNNI